VELALDQAANVFAAVPHHHTARQQLLSAATDVLAISASSSSRNLHDKVPRLAQPDHAHRRDRPGGVDAAHGLAAAVQPRSRSGPSAVSPASGAFNISVGRG
jgi:hypothetical protein